MLTFQNLQVGYRKPFFEPVNYEMEAGKLYVIAGRNGTGKSTLLKTLLKIIPPLHGNIFYKQKSIETFSPNQWSEVMAAVFSRLHQIPTVKTGEILSLGARQVDLTLQQSIVEMLNIEKLLSQSLHTLSDGQLQRILIARALIQDTPMIAMDEPTAHLDFYAKREIFELISTICRDWNKTIIMISHELELSKQYADKILLIDAEKLQCLEPQNFLPNL